MPNTINSRQIFFVYNMTLTSYSIVTVAKDMAQSAGTGAWLTVLVTALIFSLAAACAAGLGNMYKEKMLFDYAPSLIGYPMTLAVVFFLILYFLFILVFLVTSMTVMTNANFLLDTPPWALAAFSIPLFCFIAYKGVTGAARIAEAVGIVFLVVAISVHAFMLTDSNLDWIRPFFNPSDIGKYAQGFKYSVFPFLGLEILYVFPLSDEIKRPARAAFLSLLFIGLFYILMIECCIAKVGITHLLHHKDALIVALRNTSPQTLQVLARMDILYLTVGYAGLFTGISIVMLAVVEYVCRVFRRVSRLVVVIAVGAAAFLLFLFVKDIKGYEEFVLSWGTLAGLVASLVLPFSLLLIAKLKNRKNKGG